MLWAEALHAYRNGEDTDIPFHLIEDRDSMNSQFLLEDTYLKDRLTDKAEAGLPWVLSDLIGDLGLENNTQSQSRLKRALKAAGWQEPDGLRKINGRVGRWWVPPLTE